MKIVITNHARNRMLERIERYNKKYDLTFTYDYLEDLVIHNARTIKEISEKDKKVFFLEKKTKVLFAFCDHKASDNTYTRVIITVILRYLHNKQILVLEHVPMEQKSKDRRKQTQVYKHKKRALEELDYIDEYEEYFVNH